MLKRNRFYIVLAVVVLLVLVVLSTVGWPIIQRIFISNTTGNYVSQGYASGTLNAEVRSSGVVQAYLDNGITAYCTANDSLKQQLLDIVRSHEARKQIAVVTIEYTEPTIADGEWAKCKAEAVEGAAMVKVTAVLVLGHSVLVAPD